VLNKNDVMEYCLSKDLINVRGCARVRNFIHRSTDSGMVSRAKRHVGQLGKKIEANEDDDPDVDAVHETEDMGSDFASKFVRLKWECLKYGVLFDIVQHPFQKNDIYRHIKGDLTLKQICVNLMTKKSNRLKRLGEQETFCSLPFEEYESMTPTQKNSFKKAIETERRWSNFNLEVCHICQGCHLGTMKRTIVELGHSVERQTMPICDSCADNQIKNTCENRVIPYWIDKYGSRNVDVPQELRDLTFAEKQLIDLASAHVSLIHLKNETLGSRERCVSAEQKISELFLVLPRKPGDLDFLNVIRSERSSDQEVYERVFKVKTKGSSCLVLAC
jgi:hypothetical protein